MKSFVSVTDISIVNKKQDLNKMPSKAFSGMSKSKNISPEINVIGQTVDEMHFQLLINIWMIAV